MQTQAYFVYKITCRNNGKCYIGVTKHPKQRYKDHCFDARHNSPFPVHNAMRKHGIHQFDFEVIYGSKDEKYIREEMETYFINLYDSHRNGYNCTDGGEGTSGHIPTEETRQKRSKTMKEFHADPTKNVEYRAAMKAMAQRPEVRQQRSEAAKKRWADPVFKGKMQAKYATEEQQTKRSQASARPCSEETKLKIRQAQIGQPKSEEQKAKSKAAWTPEARKEQRTKMLGNKNGNGSHKFDSTKPRKKFSEETLQRIREAAQRRGEQMKGRILSEETKQKMSIAGKKRCELQRLQMLQPKYKVMFYIYKLTCLKNGKGYIANQKTLLR